MFRIPELNKARMVLLVALLFTTLGAGVFRTPPILFMAAVLCGAPIVGSLVGRLAARCLRTTRLLPDTGMVGDLVRARITVRNISRWPLFLVHGSSGEVQTRRGARTTGPALPPPVEPQGDSELVVPILGPGSELTWEATWRLTRRGVHLLNPAGAGALDPLGLYTHLGAKSQPHEMLVLPRPIKINRIGWAGGVSGGARTPTQPTVVAEALDFHGVRPHRPGEGMRRIHWRSTARTGELHVLEWEEEKASDLTVILDTQAAISVRGIPDRDGKDFYTSDTFETNIILAATLASYLLENGYQFQLFCWENDHGSNPVAARHEARNLGGLPVILRALARLQPVASSDASAARLAAGIRRYIPPGRGVMLLTTDLSDVQGAVRQLSERSGPPAQALVLDALSFAGAGAAGAIPTGAKRLPPGARLVRRGESLSNVLEQGA